MGKRKLSDEQVRHLRAAYEDWNPHSPDSPTADELASQFGISKQTMYTLRTQWLNEDKAGDAGQTALVEELRGVIRYLTEQLLDAKLTIRSLEDQLEKQ